MKLTGNHEIRERMTGRVYRWMAALLCVVFLAVPMPAFADSVLYWPVPASRTISQGFHDNNAIDISAAEGTPIYAAQSGTVTHIWLCPNTHHSYGDCNGFGTGLVILGDDGRAYQYAHMQAGSIPSNVYRTARVAAGQQIGRVGQTGYAYGAHLHFGIAYNSQYWTAGPNPATLSYRYDAPSGGGSTVNVSIGSLRSEVKSDTNAKITATLSKTPGVYVNSCGIYLGTSSGAMTKRNTESVGSGSNNYQNGTGFDIWYDLTGELGIVLTPGTTYYYKFYAVAGGKEYTSTTASFKTTGTAPSTKKTVKKAQPMKVTPTAKTYKASALKKKAKSFTYKITKAQGRLTWSSNSRYVTLSGSKIKIKKGTPKGTYKITIRAAGNSKYKAGSKVITIRVK